MNTNILGAASRKWGGFTPNAIWKVTSASVYVREVLANNGNTKIIFESGHEEWVHISTLIFDPVR